MALSLQQLHKQTQQLIMTPQMQQSIQLLQMNALELEQLAQTELLENPFLQIDDEQDESGEKIAEASPASPESLNGAEPSRESSPDDFLAPVEREVLSTEGSVESTGVEEPVSLNGATSNEVEPSAVSDVTLEDQPEQFTEVDISWDDYYDDPENRSFIHDSDEEERDFTEYTAAKVSLYDHLMWQLRLCSLEGKAAEVGEYLVGCVDEDGYVAPDCLEEAIQRFGISLEEAERILSVLQEFEPVGVGARNPIECLLIQMKALGSYSDTARIVLEQHFEELQRKKFRSIARVLNVEESRILDIYHKVSRLEPKPGRAFTRDTAQYIEPDVVVKLIDGNLSIFLNEGKSGHLSINKFYRRMLRMQAKALTKEDKAYATEKFRSALILIKNIEKRKSTILRVTEAIMEVQREFLEKGVEALKPLTLREVADMVGMHESTVARVTSKKYVETPQGVYSLKYFFSSGIGTSDGSGDAVSSRTIKDKLADLISREEPKHPLSDQKIAEILNGEGFDIARRTVAKYREQLRILPAKLRRQA